MKEVKVFKMQTQPEIQKFLRSFFTNNNRSTPYEKSPVYTAVIKCSNIELCCIIALDVRKETRMKDGAKLVYLI